MRPSLRRFTRGSSQPPADAGQVLHGLVLGDQRLVDRLALPIEVREALAERFDLRLHLGRDAGGVDRDGAGSSRLQFEVGNPELADDVRALAVDRQRLALRGLVQSDEQTGFPKTYRPVENRGPALRPR